MPNEVLDLDDGKRSVIGRVLDILECFGWGEPEQTILTLCEHTSLPRATVHRHVAALVEWGALERLSRGNYRLGMRMWQLGWGVPNARMLRDVARPQMVDLYAATGEIVVLASRDGDKLFMVDQIAGASSGTAWDSTRRVALGSVAPGLVFLAHMSSSGVRELIGSSNLGLPMELAGNQFRLQQVLDHVRTSGVAVTKRGGRCWMAAPILSASREVRSTLSLVVPTDRIDVIRHATLIKAAARAISQGLATNPQVVSHGA